MMLGDGMMGQIKEPVLFPDPIDPQKLPKKEWALTGRGDGPSRFLASLVLDPQKMENHNWNLFRKYEEITKNETRFETYCVEDAEIIAVAYGTTSRIAKGAIQQLRKQGRKVGLVRPITLWPFPNEILRELSKKVKQFIALEMSTGQMVDDVRLALEGRAEVLFYGRPGGIIPEPDEFAEVIRDKMKS
jgi:2-oxoglutarate ferredoxin oxidoreductase subunit alpha